MRKLAAILAGIITSTAVTATANDSTQPATQTGVVIKQDSRIELLNKQFGNSNRKAYLKPHLKREQGYRLQVIKTNDRSLAYKIKGDLLEKFPSEKAYLAFQSPFFRVRFGNFKTAAEALEFRDNFLGYMNQNIYAVKDVIEYMWYPSKEEEEGVAAN